MRIAVISDLHANLPATEVVFKSIDDHNVDEIVCCGDIIGYYTNPLEVIEIVKKRVKYSITGNHDSITVTDDFQSEARYFNEAARRALIWTRKLLKPNLEYWSFIKQLPLTKHIVLDGYKFFLAHGTPTAPEEWEYFYYFGVSDQEAEMNDWLIEYNADIIALGHTHVPFRYTAQKKPFRGVLNPGSVGQPRDGDPRASFAIVDTNDHTVTHYRLKYNVDSVFNDLKKNGLPDILGKRLYLGR